MGHRDVKRVPLDFDWPLNKVWDGYLQPDTLREQKCEPCDGTGYGPEALHLNKQWWGYVPFHPVETGSTPLTAETPEVRAFAERNVESAPDFYGTSETDIVREATRLLRHWNGMWQHHVSQDDVEAMVAAGCLYEFTRRFVPGEGWQTIEPAPTVTAEEVNRWAIINPMGLSSSDGYAAIKARCERLGVSYSCGVCDGHGQTEKYPGQRLNARLWKPTDPPDGPGWQLWETTSEGSPVSPVFGSAAELAAWCTDNATVFASMKATYTEWYRMIAGDTLDVGSLGVIPASGPMTFLGRASEKNR